MAKTTYTATHNGRSFTRKSHRTYTHAVLVPVSKAARREEAASDARRVWKTNLAWQQSTVDGTNPHFAKYPEQYTPELLEKERQDAAAWLANGEDGMVADALARFDARAAEWELDADGDTLWLLSGFCGREDLARKLAAKDPGAIIVPAVAK